MSQQQAPLNGILTAAWSLDWIARRRLFGDPSSFNSKPQYLAILLQNKSLLSFVFALLINVLDLRRLRRTGARLISMDEPPFAQRAQRDAASRLDGRVMFLPHPNFKRPQFPLISESLSSYFFFVWMFGFDNLLRRSFFLAIFENNWNCGCGRCRCLLISIPF